MEAKRTSRSIEGSKQKLWAYSIEKENELRLKWFNTNEPRLQAIANKKKVRQVPSEIRDLKESIIASFQKVKRYVTPPNQDPVPPEVNADAVHNVMKPVDPAIKNLLFSGTEKNGRVNYLRERNKLIPEQRYYFTETTNFEYGWNMWNAHKDVPASNFARQQVIKESFYRRRGVERDPDWYKEPAKISPSVCGCA